MPENRTTRPPFEVDRRLLRASSWLVAVGGLLFAAGAALGAGALASAGRRWVGQLEEPPSATARRRLAQANAAATAAAHAWRESAPSHQVLPEQRPGSEVTTGSDERATTG